MTGIAQVAFHNRASGSPITVDGKVVGSRLLAQAYQLPVLDKNGKPKKDSDGNPVTQPDPKYFQPRPSQTGYNANGTFFSNRGPNQASARYFYRERIAAYIALEGTYDPGLKAADVPQDAVTDLRAPASIRTSRRPTRRSSRTASPPFASCRWRPSSR